MAGGARRADRAEAGGATLDVLQVGPALVALQVRDWWPDVENSAAFFMATPPLAEWLTQAYEQVEGPAGFSIWMRRGGRS